jgi:hypothetical protein
MEPKGFFQSAIILNSVFAGGFGILVLAIDPISSLCKTAMPANAKSIDDIAAIIRLIGGAGVIGGTNGAIASRAAKGDIYTPTWAPGPNKTDLVNTDPRDRVADVGNYAPVQTDDMARTIAAASRFLKS